jgi:hypothetical protein
MEINWEKVGDVLVDSIKNSDEFKKFCDERACAFEDEMREQLEKRFVLDIRSIFKFDDNCDEEFEFVTNMEYGLLHAFNKYYVTEYLGLSWEPKRKP